MNAARILTAIVPVADILERPAQGNKIGKGESQLLFGESFLVEKEADGWVKGSSAVDGYTGFVRADCLGERKAPATHCVIAPIALLFPEPDFKTRPLLNLSFLSRLTVFGSRENSGFLWCENAGWVHESHVLPLPALKESPPAPVETALLFLNAPYRYGGRLAWGLDCSALVQLALMRAGLPCPRDSGAQEKSLGKAVEPGKAKRGDLVFFEGHVGIVAEAETVLNASMRTGRVALEPLPDLVKAYGGSTSVRRL